MKNAYCDLYFHDIPKNVSLDLETLINFANEDVAFRNSLGDSYDNLCNVYSFLIADADSDINIQLLNNYQLNYNIMEEYYLMCRERFKDLVSQSINQDVTSNIKPEILLSSSDKEVQIYTIENQTDIQENITMLISSVPKNEDAVLFKQKYYSDENSEIKNGRRSCSLINQFKLDCIFGGGKDEITFGYNDLNGRIITSATLRDGQTDGNEERFRGHRKNVQSDFMSVENFIEYTQGHTEITVNMGTTGEVMKPSFILVTDTPTQFEIDVAAEFDIPIWYLNINAYEQHPEVDINKNFESYDYTQFWKR